MTKFEWPFGIVSDPRIQANQNALKLYLDAQTTPAGDLSALVWFSANATSPPRERAAFVNCVQQVKLTAPAGATNWDNSLAFRQSASGSRIYVDALPDGRIIIFQTAMGGGDTNLAQVNFLAWDGTTRWLRASVNGSIVQVTFWRADPLDAATTVADLDQNLSYDLMGSTGTLPVRQSAGATWFSPDSRMTIADYYIWFA